MITPGLITYPGLPGPEVTPHLTRAGSREHYAPGVEFAIDRVSMVGNTGTYLDSPYHRYAGGTDLAGLPLSSLLTELDQVPPTGARFTAAPPLFAGLGTFPVRAFAAVPESGAAQ